MQLDEIRCLICQGRGWGQGEGGRSLPMCWWKVQSRFAKRDHQTLEWKHFQIQWGGQKFLSPTPFPVHVPPSRNYTMVGSLVGNLSKIKILCVLNCRKLNRSQMWIVKFKEGLDPGHLKNQEQISVWNYSVSVVSFRFDSVTSNEIQSAENQQKEVYLVAGTSHMVPVVMDAEGVLLCWEFTSSPKVWLQKCYCLISVNVNSLFAFSALLYHMWSF